MKIEIIKCDRCGLSDQPGGLAQSPRPVVVKLYRVGDHAAIAKILDLCDDCYDMVMADVREALKE